MDEIVAQNGQLITAEMINEWEAALERDEWPDGWVNVGEIIEVKRTDDVLFIAEDGTPVTGNMIQDWYDAYDRGELPEGVVAYERLPLHSEKTDALS